MIKQVQRARKLGIPTSDINALMKAARISEKNRMAILKGQIPEWEMSKRFTQSAQNRAALTAASQQRAQEVKQLMEERRALIRKLMQEYQPAVRLSVTQQLKATQ